MSRNGSRKPRSVTLKMAFRLLLMASELRLPPAGQRRGCSAPPAPRRRR